MCATSYVQQTLTKSKYVDMRILQVKVCINSTNPPADPSQQWSFKGKGSKDLLNTFFIYKKKKDYESRNREGACYIIAPWIDKKEKFNGL